MFDRLRNKLNRGLIFKLVICVAIALAAEVFLCNLSFWSNLRNTPVSLIDTEANAATDATGHYEGETIEVNDYVRNVDVQLALTNCESAEVKVMLSDEGDAYEYELPSYRVVPQVKTTGYCDIHPYGKVKTIRVSVDVPEGSAANIESIRLNVVKPFKIHILRLLILIAVIILICTVATDDGLNATDACLNTVSKRIIVIVAVIALILVAKWLSTSNELLVSCPWPHHKQYAELAHYLKDGNVKLLDREVDERLLQKENPYDTSALMIEQIPYNMDFAYYDGAYYVYFGIVPEVVFYLPYYLITGNDLPNYHVMWMLSSMLIVGIFYTVWQLARKFCVDSKGQMKLTFGMYMFISVAMALLSNNVYLMSNPDIYNIPVMMATACLWWGIGLWTAAVNICDGKSGYSRVTVCVLAALGSLSMALIAGCRPQMCLFAIIGILLIARGVVFRKDKAAETVALVVPFVIVAVVVCAYNYARFNNIFDFGATYSMTSNDMNHRGFNIDRLLRGLYSFFLQPPVLTHDFSFMDSAAIDSAYMGKNLVEFTYGGIFATNVMSLAIFAPAVGKKKLNADAKFMILTTALPAVVIAAFDVNGAGILYRYTCDFVPGMVIAALVVWLVGLRTDNVSYSLVRRLCAIALLMGLGYAFLTFVGPGENICLHDNSVVLYEQIRELFRL
ncbi:MAG: hypothetical protein KBT19_00540 [Lachnospiraceae bacterium]|nr:hypothetical protein [Candidatus Colinaster equi]